MIRNRISIIVAFFFLLNISTFAQSSGGSEPFTVGQLAGQVNPLTSAVPFLMIAPDSRGGGMGDVGAATSPDVYSVYWNPAKLAFCEQDMSAAFSFTPWLRELVDDIYIAQAVGYKRLDKDQVIGASLRYFSLGQITFRGMDPNEQGRDYTPNELAVDLSYARKFSKKLSGSIALRYIYSNLTGGALVDGAETHAGHAVAADLSSYYRTKLKVQRKDAELAFGVHISNIGTKISYTDESQQNFIPINMKLGSAFTLKMDDYNSLTFAADLNKLLVPTPPKKQSVPGEDGENNIITHGQDDDVSVAAGIFQSFGDAPGGFEEELHEIAYSFGLEYWYAKQFALRGGYFHEHETKGNRKFFSIGLGLKLSVMALDFAYLIPTENTHPLANTLRFSLRFDLESWLVKNKETR